MNTDINRINPYIRVTMNSSLSAGFTIAQRILFDYELIYLEKGQFILKYNGQEYNCRQGQFIFIRPGVPHSFHCTMGEIQQPHIHFDIFYTEKSPKIPVSFKDLQDFSPYERSLISDDIFENYPLLPIISFKDNNEALRIFYSIINSAAENLLSRKADLIKIIEILISDNFPDCFSNSGNTYNIARQLKDYIDAGQGYTATLEDFENLFSYSKFHLEREFKKCYGISIMAYRNEKRMNKAEELLQSQSVCAVAEALGFSSIYVFSRAFKQHFGISPTKYKE